METIIEDNNVIENEIHNDEPPSIENNVEEVVQEVEKCGWGRGPIPYWRAAGPYPFSIDASSSFP